MEKKAGKKAIIAIISILITLIVVLGIAAIVCLKKANDDNPKVTVQKEETKSDQYIDAGTIEIQAKEGEKINFADAIRKEHPDAQNIRVDTGDADLNTSGSYTVTAEYTEDDLPYQVAIQTEVEKRLEDYVTGIQDMEIEATTDISCLTENIKYTLPVVNVSVDPVALDQPGEYTVIYRISSVDETVTQTANITVVAQVEPVAPEEPSEQPEDTVVAIAETPKTADKGEKLLFTIIAIAALSLIAGCVYHLYTPERKKI